MSRHQDAGVRGFAASLSATEASKAFAWAIAIKPEAVPSTPRQLRWLPHPETRDLADELQSGEIALWMAMISEHRAEADSNHTGLDLAQASAVLDAAEIDRALRLVHDTDRRSFAASHAGARLLLGSALNQKPDDLRFLSSTLGKPMLADTPGLQFSISHAREAVTVASAREPIGVDLEPLRELDQLGEISELVLAADERAVVARAPAALRSRLFLRYWTLKEALLKAAGFGFSIPPNTILIDAGNIPAVVSAPAILEADTQWQFIAPALDPQLAEWINGAA